MMNEKRLKELGTQWRQGAITVTDEDVDGLIEYAVRSMGRMHEIDDVERETGMEIESASLSSMLGLQELAESLPGRSVSATVSIYIETEGEDDYDDD